MPKTRSVFAKMEQKSLRILQEMNSTMVQQVRKMYENKQETNSKMDPN